MKIFARIYYSKKLVLTLVKEASRGHHFYQKPPISLSANAITVGGCLWPP